MGFFSSVSEVPGKTFTELEKDNKRLLILLDDERTGARRSLEESNHQHKMDIESKNFEMKYNVDEKVKELEDRIAVLNIDVSGLTKEKELLEKMVDINADIVDVKDLVKNLINKLPEVNLKNLSVNIPQVSGKN